MMKREQSDDNRRSQNRGGDKPEPDPYEIEFLPQFKEGKGPKEKFVNQYGVTIGDHQYESPESPLNQWSENTDPEVMAGDEWVHPYKDIGFQSAENRDYFEKGIAPQSGIFMHADKDAAYPAMESDPWEDSDEENKKDE